MTQSRMSSITSRCFTIQSAGTASAMTCRRLNMKSSISSGLRVSSKLVAIQLALIESQDATKFNRHGLRSSPMRVCLNTDDPGIMPTSITHEHWLPRRAAPAGIEDEEINIWQGRLRQYGLDLFDKAHQKWYPSVEKMLPRLKKNLVLSC